MARPDALGADVEISDFDVADQALHELAWLLQDQARLDALCQQKIEALKDEFAAKAVIQCGRTEVTYAARREQLEAALAQFALAHAGELLTGKKRTRAFAHGELGLRQQPLVVILGSDDAGTPYKPAAVLEWIAESDLSKKQRDALVETTTKLHLKGAKDALDSRLLTRDQLAAIGLAIREPYDEAVVKPAKVLVTAE